MSTESDSTDLPHEVKKDEVRKDTSREGEKPSQKTHPQTPPVTRIQTSLIEEMKALLKEPETLSVLSEQLPGDVQAQAKEITADHYNPITADVKGMMGDGYPEGGGSGDGRDSLDARRPHYLEENMFRILWEKKYDTEAKRQDFIKNRTPEQQAEELSSIRNEADRVLTQQARADAIRREREYLASLPPEQRAEIERLKKERDDLKAMGKDVDAEDRELQVAILRGTNAKTIEAYKSGEMDRVTVHTEYGTPVDYFIPRELDKKVRWMREYLNEIEDTITAEGRQTQKLKLQELFLVLPVLAAGPEGSRVGMIKNYRESDDVTSIRWKEQIKPLGEVMDQEFWRTFHLHQFYVGYYNAGDVNAAGQAIGSMYSYQRNFLLKDSNVAYTHKTADSGPATEAGKRANLQIKRFYRKYDNKKKAFEFLSMDEKGQNELRDKWIEEVAREMQKDASFGLSDTEIEEAISSKTGIYIDLKFAQTKAERLWELDLRRHKHDVLVTEDKANIPKQNVQAAKSLAMAGKLDYLSKARNGNFPTRRAFALRNRLFSQGKAKNMHLDRLDNVDFWNRDLLSVLPGELEGDYTTKLDTIYHRQGIQNHYQLAQQHAIELVEAVFGLRKQGVDLANNKRGSWPETDDKDIAPWAWTEEKYTDVTGAVWRWEDFEEIDDKVFLEFDSANKIKKTTRMDTIKKFTNDKADPEIKELVDGLVKDGFIDYNYKLEVPIARIARHLMPQEGIRAEFEGKTDSYVRMFNLSAEKVIATIQSFDFMAGKQYDEAVTMMRNFAREKMQSGGPTANPRSIDFLLSNIGGTVNMPQDQLIKLGKILESELYSPILDFFSYMPLDKGSLAFLLYFITHLPEAVFGK